MIYLIRNDGYRFQELDLEVNDLIDNFPEDIDYRGAHDFALNNLSLSQSWTPVETSFSPIDNPEAPIPDIAKWIDATLVLSQRAYEALYSSLAECGEFLPISANGQKYYLFNCLTCVGIDQHRSQKCYYEGEDIGFEKLAFQPTAATIFKSPDQGCQDLFCQESIKDLVERHALTGTIFDANLAFTYEPPAG
jgi:hypothetical protein